MKQIIVCMAICLSFLSLSSYAQQGGGGERYKQMLKDSLQLTDVQIDTVIAVRQDFGPQMKDIYMDQTLSDADKQAKMAVLKPQMEARLKGTLTDDQIVQLEAFQERQRAARMRNRGGQ